MFLSNITIKKTNNLIEHFIIQGNFTVFLNRNTKILGIYCKIIIHM